MSCLNSTASKLVYSPTVSTEFLPMMPHQHDHSQHETLRQRAEHCYASRNSGNPGPADPLDAQRLLQELEIHQIELEMQNMELQQARNEAEEAREIYRDLYDFAPVGYFTLSREGDILMANLTGATLLGLERDGLTGCSFSQWIVPNQRHDFGDFLTRVLNGKDLLSIELEILQVGGKRLIADIEARKGVADRVCRMMVTDVTRRKAEEKAKSLLNISTRSNRKLQAEVLHWREVESSLEVARGLSDCLDKPGGKQKEILSLSNALIRAQEEERKRISRELHDRIILALEAIQHELDLRTL